MKDETARMFFEEARGCICPKCGGDATYWEVGGDGDSLIDTLNCEGCGFTWERVYKYAWSREGA